jgi:hypothetical protein
MDKKIFEQFIKMHCEVTEPVWTETVFDSELDPETGLEQIIQREVEVQGPLTVVKRKPHIHGCQHCGKTVTDQQVQVRLAQDPVPHWRTRCHTCKCYINPETNQPIEDQHLSTALSKISSYHKNKKFGLKQFKTNTSRPYTLSSMDTSGKQIHTQVEDSGDTTITRYFYHKDK